jgi:UDP-glucuronate 4-epimerase
VQIDTTRMHELIGPTSVDWRDGMERMARALHPDKVH